MGREMKPERKAQSMATMARQRVVSLRRRHAKLTKDLAETDVALGEALKNMRERKQESDSYFDEVDGDAVIKVD